jgi:hypothetical protein
MVLMCAQHARSRKAHYFAHNAAVYWSALPGQDLGAAICQAAVDEVPPDDRSDRPTSDGLNVYWAHSDSNLFPGDDLSMAAFKRDGFYFSVSPEAAKRYLKPAYAMLGGR